MGTVAMRPSLGPKTTFKLPNAKLTEAEKSDLSEFARTLGHLFVL